MENLLERENAQLLLMAMELLSKQMAFGLVGLLTLPLIQEAHLQEQKRLLK